jgi:hypothetical protein
VQHREGHSEKYGAKRFHYGNRSQNRGEHYLIMCIRHGPVFDPWRVFLFLLCSLPLKKDKKKKKKKKEKKPTVKLENRASPPLPLPSLEACRNIAEFWRTLPVIAVFKSHFPKVCLRDLFNALCIIILIKMIVLCLFYCKS